MLSLNHYLQRNEFNLPISRRREVLSNENYLKDSNLGRQVILGTVIIFIWPLTSWNQVWINSISVHFIFEYRCCHTLPIMVANYSLLRSNNSLDFHSFELKFVDLQSVVLISYAIQYAALITE